MGYKPFTIGAKAWKGYTDDAQNAGVDILCPPSVNCTIDKNGVAKTRKGYEDTGLDLSQSGKPARAFYVPNFDVTFFAVGTKVYYIVGEPDSATKYDTGITLTDGTTSRFEEHNGVVYVTNATDGCYGFLLTRLNGAVSAGAASIVTDVEGAGVASAFDTALSPGTKNLRINGTNEQYSSITVATGTFTLSGTASQSYTDDTIALVVYVLTGTFPKCDKIVAWRETLHFIGLSANTANAASSDRLQTSLVFTKSATATASENVLSFSSPGGSELVGKSGKLVNAVATRDYLYLFKDNGVYYIGIDDINTSTGARPPRLLSENYGCLNADSAVDMGNGEVAFITNTNRIIRIKIASDSGAPVVFPDETFDRPYSNTLPMMDQSQPDAQFFYDTTQKRAFAQVTVDGNVITLPYNQDIGAWEPPFSGYFFKSHFIRKGIHYATDRTDDTVYKLDLTLDDDGTPIECVMASSIVEFEDGRVTCKFDQLELSGALTENAEIQAETIVNKGTSQTKTIDATGVNFGSSPALGSVAMGSVVLGDGDMGDEMGDFDKRFAIYPSLGSDLQIILSTAGEGQAFAWNSYTIRAKAMTSSALTLS